MSQFWVVGWTLGWWVWLIGKLACPHPMEYQDTRHVGRLSKVVNYGWKRVEAENGLRIWLRGKVNPVSYGLVAPLDPVSGCAQRGNQLLFSWNKHTHSQTNRLKIRLYTQTNTQQVDYWRHTRINKRVPATQTAAAQTKTLRSTDDQCMLKHGPQKNGPKKGGPKKSYRRDGWRQ